MICVIEEEWYILLFYLFNRFIDLYMMIIQMKQNLKIMKVSVIKDWLILFLHILYNIKITNQ